MVNITNCLINKLTYNWYIRLKNEFETHNAYFSELNKICIESDTYDSYKKPNDFDIVIELKEYAWDNIITESHYSMELNEKREISASRYFEYIIEIITKDFNQTTEEFRYKYLIELSKSLKTTFDKIKDKYNNKQDDIFFSTMDYIYFKGII